MKVVFGQVVLAILLAGLHLSSQQVFRHFNGGSLSFNVVWNNASSKWQVELDVITGWVLGFGPCGEHCSKASVGNDTQASRLASEQNLAPALFGNWSIEYKPKNESKRKTEGISDIVRQHSSGKTIAMNKQAMWEQEWLTTVIDPMENSLKRDRQDIIFAGQYWHNLSLQGSEVEWHMQSKVDLRLRDDTGLPNGSPKAMVKPFYRLKLNKKHTIFIPAIDPDGDVVKCEASQYIEAGAKLGVAIQGMNVHMDEEDHCVVDIDSSDANGFSDDYWLAVAVTIRDLNKQNLKLGDDMFRAYAFSMSSTSVQFLVQVLEHLDEPVFVEPTKPDNHEFFVFGGASWSTEVHAEASINATIDDFFVVTRLGEPVTGSQTMDHPSKPLVKYVTLSWTPLNADKGDHIVCVRATDNTGVDTEADRCFIIHVIPDKFNRTEIATGKPYFVDLPSTPEEIGCKVEASCIVPLFVKSDSPLDKIDIKIPADNTDGNVQAIIGTIKSVVHDGVAMYQADLAFTHYIDGIKEFCLTAYDTNGISSNETCVRSAIMPTDPCLTSPCMNSGACSRNPDNWVDYMCDCIKTGAVLYGGKNCDERINMCEPTPCQNGGSCFAMGLMTICRCTDAFTGSHCETDINECKAEPCGNRGVCADHEGSYSCQCFGRYNGTDCTNDRCPSAQAGALTCPATNGDCISNTCNNQGVCFPGPTCLCSAGFTGSSCATPSTDPTAPLRIIPPTLDGGSKLTCYHDDQGLQPCSLQIFVESHNGPLTDVSVSRASGTFVSGSSVDGPQQYTIDGLHDTFMSTINIDGNKDQGKNVVCIKATQGTDSDERCFELIYMTDPVNIAGSEENNQKDKAIKFIAPSPLAGSRLSCMETQQCHLLLYTTLPSSGTCDAVVAVGHQDVGVFSSNPSAAGTECVTEVAYSFPASGEQILCFISSPQQSDAQKRCFTVDVLTQGSDPCNTGPGTALCQNDGVCMHRGTSASPYCICQQGYEGDNCETGPCLPRDNHCGTGYCSVNNTVKTCLCSPGHAGVNCDTDLGASIPDAKESGAQFTDLTVPETIVCNKNRPCVVPFMLSGTFPPGEGPSVSPGFISPDVTVSRLVAHPDGAQPGHFQGVVEFTSKTSGIQDVCLQTQNDKGENKDEICFKVSVTTDTSLLYNRKDRPYFIEPSLSAGSTVRCEVDTVCHVLFRATPGDTNEDKCIKAWLKDSNFSVVHISSSCDDCVEGQTGTGNCSTDIVMRPEPAHLGSDVQLCLNLGLKGARADGEQRCFHVNVQSQAQIDDRGSCRTTTCHNGGFCDGHNPSAVCYCSQGFSGDTCANSTAGNGTNGGLMSLVGDKAVPQQISCGLNETCTLPLQIFGPSGVEPIVSMGYVDPRLDIKGPRLTNNTNDNTDSIIEITPLATGPHTVCVQTNNISLTTDEVCVVVNVGSTGSYVDQLKAHFVAPTIPAESTLACGANESCHLSVYYDKDSSNNCPSLVESGSHDPADTVHMFDTVVTTVCSNDVLFYTTVAETHRLCLQLTSGGQIGEKRCFFISAKESLDEVKSACSMVTCDNGAKCVTDVHSQPSTADCICSPGFTGHDCSQGAANQLPGVTNISTLLSSLPPQTPTFDGTSAIPKSITCIPNTECILPVPFLGSSDKPPLPGYVDPSLHLDTDQSVVTPDSGQPASHILMSKFTPTQPGTHIICMQTTVNGSADGMNIDEVCYTIIVNSSAPAATAPDPLVPHFTSTTVPKDTSLLCLPDQVCHIPVQTSPDSISGSCAPVKECDSGLTGLHVFKPQLVNGTCYTDVGYKTGSSSNVTTLCLSAGPGGEARNFTLETQDTKVFGPCQSLHCLNGGLCIGETTPAKCFCKVGFEGDTCQTASTTSGSQKLPGVQNLPVGTTAPHGFIPSTSLPATIKCTTNEACAIPIMFTGSVPPIPGYTDPSLHMNTSSGVITPDPSSNSSHLALGSVTPTSPGNHTVCLQTTADGTQNSANIDEICFTIETTDPTGTSPAVDQNKPHYHASNLPDKSTVTCAHDTMCHLPLVTEPGPDGQCAPVQRCGVADIAVHMFPPTMVDGVCVTDVGLMTGHVDVTNDLCLSAGPGGENRTVVIQTANKTEYGPCQILHCQNGGVCKGDTTPAKCVCSASHQGDACDNAVSPTVTLPGVTGTPPTSGSSPHFDTNMAVPDVVTCEAGTPCTIPIPFNGDFDKPPVIGYTDPTLQPTPDPKVQSPDPTHPNDHLLMTSLIPTVPGTHTLCMQTTQDGLKNGTNLDEICMNITVAPQGTTISSVTPGKPQFSANSLSNGTSMTCPVESVCHLPVITDQTPNGHCDPVQECGAGVSGVHVFDTKPDGDKCYTDVGYRTGQQAQTTHLCLSSGPDGEERQFTLNTANKTDPVPSGTGGYGPCQKLHCINGGVCKGDTDPAKCVCPPGFDGETCDTPLSPTDSLPGVTGAPSATGSTPYFDPNMALPDHVTCVAGTPCTIPIPFKGDLDKPPVIGYTDPTLQPTPDPKVESPDPTHPNDHLLMTSLIPTAPGTHTLCMQTTQGGLKNGTNLDEICMNITVAPQGTTISSVTPGKPQFSDNTLSNGTSMTCRVGFVCHLPVITDQTPNGHCDPVQECGAGVSGVHVFATRPDGDKCFTDVGYRTGQQAQTTHLCLSSGPDGEERQFTLNTANKTGYGPCQKLHCINGGVCKGDTDPAKCVCPPGFDGETCDTPLSPTDSLPGVTGAPSATGSTPYFDPNMALPDHVTCVAGTPCTIPIPFKGDLDKPPSTGYVDPDLKVLPDPDVITPSLGSTSHVSMTTVVPVKQGEQRLCIQTTTDGTQFGTNIDEICVNITVQPEGTVQPTPLPGQSQFHGTSLPNGTTVTCLLSTVCHVQMVTEPGQDNKCPMLEECGTGLSGVHVFEPTPLDGRCYTSVGYRAGVRPDTADLCIRSGHDGEERHYTVKTDNKTEYGPCQTLHCIHGSCNGLSSTPQCLCEAGYEGNACDLVMTHDPNEQLPGVDNPPATTANTPTFLPTSGLPETVTCVTGSPCTLPLMYSGDKNTPPIVGFIDPTMSGSLTQSVMSPDPLNPSHNMALTTLTPTTAGNHTVCLHTTVNGLKGSTNIDAVCFNMMVADRVQGTQKPVNQSLPHFHDTSLAGGSSVTCLVGEFCHLPVITDPNPVTGLCEPVHECGPGHIGIHAFQPKLVDGVCVTDVGYNTGTVETSATVCLASGPNGEERNLTLITSNSREYSPCQKLHCQHGGVCKDDTTPAKCVCPPGYTGETCLTASATSSNLPSVSQAPTQTTDAPHFDGHTAIPSNITCYTNEPCSIPITFNGNPAKPPVLGYTDPSLRVETTPGIQTVTPTSHTMVTSMTPTTVGNHRVCLQTTDDGTKAGANVDEVCVTVAVATGPSPALPDPHFQDPTLPAGSTIVCQTNDTCQIPVITQPTNGTCESVQECGTGTSGVHVFEPKLLNGHCVTNIGYRTNSTDNVRDICVSTGPGGEDRHFAVETAGSHVYGPCQTLHCKNGGMCLGKISGATCLCTAGFKGAQCETAASVNISSPHLPGVENLPATYPQSPHAFLPTSSLPETILCHLNQPCTVPVMYQGSKLPVKGFVDPALSVTGTEVTPDAVSSSSHIAIETITPNQAGNHTMCLQTTTTGDNTGLNLDEVCFSVQVTSASGPSIDQTLPHFDSSTVTNGSTLTCQVDTECHIPITSGPNAAGSCDPVSECQPRGQSIHIFQPRLDQGVCLTDIVYNTDTTEDTQDLCLSAGPNGEERTYNIRTTNTREFGPCQKLHCQNGGTCLGDTPTGTCECTDGFLGHTCEKVCQNGGVADAAGLACVCRSGFSGDACQHEHGESLPSPVTTTTDPSPPTFTDLFLPEIITCEKDKSCDIAIPVMGRCTETPTIQHGHSSADLTVAPPVTTPVSTPGGSVNSTMCQYESVVSITPTVTGTSSYCIQTADIHGNNADELCFKVDTQPPTNAPDSIFAAPPTVPQNSVLACPLGQTCHTAISFHKTGSTCDNMTVSQHVPNVNIFPPTTPTGTDCTFDVAFTPAPNQTGNSTLCLKTGASQEERCFKYDVKPVEAIESGSPCRSTHCEHAGFCKSAETTATCICRPSASGERCQNANSMYLVGAVAQSVNCTVGEQCSVMIPVYTSGGSPPTAQVVQGQAIASVIPSSPSGGPHQVAVNIDPSSPLVCLNITTDPAKLPTQKCVNVNMQPANASNHNTQFPQSTPNYKCVPDEQCTLSVVTNPDASNHCPTLRLDGGTTVEAAHVFDTRTVNSLCVSEIVTSPRIEPGTPDKQLCLATQSESKCFTVTFEEIGTCTSNVSIDLARRSTDVGLTNCYCMVNERKVSVIRRSPVPSSEALVKTACLGAACSGGPVMVATVVFLVVKMIKKSGGQSERSLPPTPRPPSRVFPHSPSSGSIYTSHH